MTATAEDKRRCPDGAACGHSCGERTCFRILFAGPRPGVYPGDVWPRDVFLAEAAKGSASDYPL
jgi:hypothetical protein